MGVHCTRLLQPTSGVDRPANPKSPLFNSQLTITIHEPPSTSFTTPAFPRWHPLTPSCCRLGNSLPLPQLDAARGLSQHLPSTQRYLPQCRHDEHAQQESRLPPQARPQACQSPSRWPLWIVTKCCPNLGYSSPDDYIGRRPKRDTPPSPTSPTIPSKGPGSPSPRDRTARCYKTTFQR